MSINNPILIYVNKKRQIKLALFYSVVAIALMMSLFLNYSIMLKMVCVFFNTPHDSRRKCLLVLRLFRKATANVEPGGSNITHNQATNSLLA
ncbi:putative membrane protein [Salmonella enterica subsp. enterica]|nr:putative membrane protein [Salmonella enterica subsp. enterica]